MGSSSSQVEDVRKNERLRRDVEKMARGSHLTIRKGFEAVERRMVVPLPQSTSGRPRLRTILDDGSVEEERTINVHRNQSLVTYADVQLISSEIVRREQLAESRYVYDIPGNTQYHGLLQTWTLNLEGFSKVCTIMEDVDTPDFEVKIREYEEKRNAEKYGGVANTAEVDAATKKITEEARARGEKFKATAKEILGSTSGPYTVKYCLKETKVEETLFIGKGVDVLEFLDSADAQKFLRIKTDRDNRKFEAELFDSKGKAAGTKTFHMANDVDDYVIYQRQGKKSFTCVKQLSQFLKEARYLSQELTCSVDEFLKSAKLDAKLGEGAYGKVERYVRGPFSYAVKTFHHGAQSVDARNELHALKLVQQHPHPCLIHAFLIEDESDSRRVVMELGECDLYKAVMERKPNDRLKFGWLGAIFLGIERLHNMVPCPIVHRDLKPENVIITHENYAKVVDYGCSRMSLEHRASTVGRPIGTSGYMAPELLRKDTQFKHGPPVDLFSFGAIIYFVQKGLNPPGGDVPAGPQFIDAHLRDHKQLRSLIESENGSMSSWQNLALNLTEEDPNKRFSCEAVRNHDFFHELKLPEYKETLAGAELARTWLTHQFPKAT